MTFVFGHHGLGDISGVATFLRITGGGSGVQDHDLMTFGFAFVSLMYFYLY